MTSLTSFVKAKSALELGTFTGYASIAIADGMIDRSSSQSELTSIKKQLYDSFDLDDNWEKSFETTDSRVNSKIDKDTYTRIVEDIFRKIETFEAKRVYTCELDAVAANIAKANFEKHSYNDLVTLSCVVCVVLYASCSSKS